VWTAIDVGVIFSRLPRHDDREGHSLARLVQPRKNKADSAPFCDIVNMADGVNFTNLLHPIIPLRRQSALIAAAVSEMQFPYLPLNAD
jgi:hypothetical protein